MELYVYRTSIFPSMKLFNLLKPTGLISTRRHFPNLKNVVRMADIFFLLWNNLMVRIFIVSWSTQSQGVCFCQSTTNARIIARLTQQSIERDLWKSWTFKQRNKLHCYIKRTLHGITPLTFLKEVELNLMVKHSFTEVGLVYVNTWHLLSSRTEKGQMK